MGCGFHAVLDLFKGFSFRAVLAWKFMFMQRGFIESTASYTFVHNIGELCEVHV